MPRLPFLHGLAVLRHQLFCFRQQVGLFQLFGLLIGLAVLVVFKQHRHVVEPDIRQFRPPLHNGGIMPDCLLKLALPTQQRTFAVIVQNGIVVRHGAVQIQQVGQQIPLVTEDGLIDQVFGQGGIGAQVGFG